MANEEDDSDHRSDRKQGGATLRHLANRGGLKLRAMTRKPDGDAAKALAALGAEVVAGDSNDAASLERARRRRLGRVRRPEHLGGRRREARKSRASASRSSRATRACSTSSTRRSAPRTGGPAFRTSRTSFASRRRSSSSKFPSHVILRPVFFMENLPSPWFLNGDKLTTALKPETKLQMVAVDDIGKFSAAAFVEADKFKGAEIDVRGRRGHDGRGGGGDRAS